MGVFLPMKNDEYYDSVHVSTNGYSELTHDKAVRVARLSLALGVREYRGDEPDSIDFTYSHAVAATSYEGVVESTIIAVKATWSD